MKDVSVCLLTYNPIKEKLHGTLLSIIRQKNIEFEIIVSDDGSEDNLFRYIVEFFEQNKFTDYKLIANEKNEGTVINFYKTVQRSEGKYIKAISPGDELYTSTTLCEWVEKLDKSDFQWSFSDVVCYRRKNNGGREILSLRAQPQKIRCYEEKYINQNKCIWSYVVLNDIPIGVAMLVEKEMALHYLEIIKDKVIYAEDHIFRLMMYDGVCPLYNKNASIWYEHGSGISTAKNNMWETRLSKDWDVATNIMLNRFDKLNNLQVKMRKIISSQYYKHKYISLITVRGKLLFTIKRKLYPRKTKK